MMNRYEVRRDIRATACRVHRLLSHAGTCGVLLAAMTASAARANDTTAALTTGGLVFGKNANIEMRSEDLSISEKQIVVHYRFFNRAKSDETVTVAFPMPDVDWTDAHPIAVPNNESDNFLDFHTMVDGRPVAMQIEQKAFVEGRDVTQPLVALGVPLMPTAKKTHAVLDALPKAASQKLLAQKIVRPDDYDAGKGMEHHIAPLWSVRTTYYWRQTFPAGREMTVEHRYRPSVGGSVQTRIGSDYTTPAEMRDYATRYCTDKGFLSGAAGLKRKNKGVPAPELKLAYVLTTGANWAGPIGDFRLTIDKGTPDSLISFCEDGAVKKIGPTTFEVRHRNFAPTRDLDILILRVYR